MATEQNNKPNSRPTRSIKGMGNRINMRPRMRVIQLSLTNILAIAALFLLLIVVFVNNSNPNLGTEVNVDEFLTSINENRYSKVDIRDDGNAVGQPKFIQLVQESVDLDQKSDKAQIQLESNFQEKSLTDLISELTTTRTLGEEIADLFASLSGGRDSITKIIILDRGIIVDWNNEETKDWSILNVTENEFVDALSTKSVDAAQLTIPIEYLRSAGVATSEEVFRASLEESRYSQVWQIGNRTYGYVPVNKRLQQYVNYQTATPDFTKLLADEGISLTSANIQFSVLRINQLDWSTIFTGAFLVSVILLGIVMLRSMGNANGGLMKFGQSKARMFFGRQVKVKFKDVAGVEEAKEQLIEVVDFLKNPAKYQKMGAKIPRGVLMVGSPGTGKTLLARAVAGEAGVPFFHTSGSEFEEMLVGAGASRVRDLFEKAKKAAPSLIFIDEMDAVGRKRGTTIQSSSTEQTLNQILVEMDGFEPRDNVIVIAATNRPDVLDPAILRPGRFDRKVVLDAPDIEGRTAILKIHAANKPLAENVDLEKIAKRTVGFTGADLENMLNEAAIIVAKENRKQITPDDLEEAATKVQTGPVRKRNRTEEELKMTAYHEAGHAIVMKMTPQSDPVHRITILSRGMALGYTMPLPQTDQLQMTKTKMLSKICSLLGGFAAEELVFGDVTTGASNDIERATGLARQMVKQFGMSKKLGLVQYGNDNEEPHMGWGGYSRPYSEATAELIDEEVRQIINNAFKAAKKILEDNRKILDNLSNILLENEVVEATEFEEMFTSK